jgi:peptidoglycan biosynthesis protein MviN/MurJ (putative lipid II flippase)
VNVVAATTLFVMMRRRLRLEHVLRTGGVILRITIASAAAALAALAVWYGLEQLLGTEFFAQLISVAGGLAAATLAYVGASRALGVRELNTLLLLRARRDEPVE